MIRHLLASVVVAASGLTLTPSTATADPGHQYGGGYHSGHYDHHHGHHHHHRHPGPVYGYGGYRPGIPYAAPYRPVPAYVYPAPPVVVQPAVVPPRFSFGLSIIR